MDWAKGFVTYIIPVVAFVISIYSLVQSRRIGKLEEIIKENEVERIEREKEVAGKAYIEARIVKISNNQYRIKVWNSGGKRAYNINYNIPKDYQIVMMKKIVPYEYLDPGNSFEENIEYSGVKSITCPDDGNHHSGEMEITIPEVEIANMLS